MWDFIVNNSGALGALANLLMVTVWVLYFQMLLNGRRRELRAKILINRSAGRSLAGNCIVSNMSSDPIYVERIAITPKPGGEAAAISLTDLEGLSNQPQTDARAAWFQGPLQRGEYINLGSFEQLFQKLAEAAPHEGAPHSLKELDSFEVSVLADHGPDNLPVAAIRRFTRSEEDGNRGVWRAAPTRQVRSRGERMQLARRLRSES